MATNIPPHNLGEVVDACLAVIDKDTITLDDLQFTDMNSARNLAVLGTSLLGGLMVPNWVKHNSQLFNTGD
jgi:hypothetical protein